MSNNVYLESLPEGIFDGLEELIYLNAANTNKAFHAVNQIRDDG